MNDSSDQTNSCTIQRNQGTDFLGFLNQKLDKKNFAQVRRILAIASFICTLIPVFPIDHYFKFPEVSLEEITTFEKKRILCIFPFRDTKNQDKTSYLKNGIPAVLYSALKDIYYIYDENPNPLSIRHPHGSPQDKKIVRKIQTRKELEKLKAGQIVLPVEKDPRYIQFEIKLMKKDGEFFPESTFFSIKKFGCSYGITGEFTEKYGDELLTTVELTNFWDGKTEKTSGKTSLKRAYQEFNPITEKLRGMIRKNTIIPVFKIETNEDSAMVFIDKNFIGKTPIPNPLSVPPGLHEITLMKEGFITIRDRILVKKGEVVTWKKLMEKIQKKSYLSITSDPPGAEVYIGANYLGETPISKVEVASGPNQIRLLKEGHIDFFKGVDPKEGAEIVLNVKMEEGKTEEYYKSKKYFFMDFTYNDMSIYSLYAIPVFYGAFIYANVKANALDDGMRSRYSFVGAYAIYTSMTSRPANEFGSLYLYEEMNIRKINKKIDAYHKIGDQKNWRGSALYASIFMLGMAGLFYGLGLDAETVDFGFQIPTVVPYTQQREFNSYIQYNFRF